MQRGTIFLFRFVFSTKPPIHFNIVILKFTAILFFPPLAFAHLRASKFYNIHDINLCLREKTENEIKESLLTMQYHVIYIQDVHNITRPTLNNKLQLPAVYDYIGEFSLCTTQYSCIPVVRT